MLARKWDYEVLFVQSIAILAMVLGHTGPEVSFAGFTPFPYYSWHMPIFVFISGVLLSKKGSYLSFVKRKCMRLLLPALGVRLALTGLALIGSHFGLYEGGLRLSLEGLLINPFVMCNAYPLSNAMWFIFQLFVLEMIYGALIRIPGRRTEEIVLAVTLAFSLASLYVVRHVIGSEPQGFALLACRTAFLLFFMAAGHFYRRWHGHWRVSPWLVLIFVVAVQVGYLLLSGHDITFSVHPMEVFKPAYFFMPIVTTLTAAAVLLSLAKILSPHLQGRRLLEIVGGGTKDVVYFHELCLLLINCVYMVLRHRTGSALFEGFYYDMIRAPWYVFALGGSDWARLPYIVLSIALPVGCRWYVSRQPKRWARIALWCVLWLIIAAFIILMGKYAREAVGLI